MDTLWNNFTTGVINLLPGIFTAALIVAASLYLAGLIGKLLKKVLERRNADSGVTQLLVRLTYWSIVVVGLITALQRFFDVTAFLAGLGILGFTIGFALQNIMQNFVAGIILLIQKPFNVGDAIEVEDHGGTVLAINLRTTEMRTWDGRIVIIPNSDVLSHTITNLTRARNRRIEIPLGISYTSDPETARRAILEALESVPGYLSEPKAMVVFNTFGDSSVGMTVYFWIETDKVGVFAAQDAALTGIKQALERQRIEIPYPIRTVHLQQSQTG